MRNLVLETLANALASRYAVLREIGQGGAATIFLATDLKHDRLVAIKVLRGLPGSRVAAERFHREIRLLARLQHPHILPLHDSGSADGLLYYVTPYIEGESLHSRLGREKRLPVSEALRIARQIADALDYAHRRDVIHRDIKPGNILLGDGNATVADFGIARAIVNTGEPALTTSGTALGTPPYMSPEQLLGEPDVDGRSDIYSLACVLYEMLAGVPPFMGPRGIVENDRKFTDAAPSVATIADLVPAHVDEALRRALARLPGHRFATAALFAAALEPRSEPLANATPAHFPERPDRGLVS
ncbi:MAG: serine/threonine-protein kinase [Gemmatimonadaceae bacterium]